MNDSLTALAVKQHKSKRFASGGLVTEEAPSIEDSGKITEEDLEGFYAAVKEQTNINEYNNYYNFLHNYELLNRFVGRDKIIWGTWDMDLPKEKFDVFFERIDYTDDGLHPGPKSHKQYANKIKEIYESK